MAYSKEKRQQAIAYQCMQEMCHTIDRVSRRDRGFKHGFKIVLKDKSKTRLQ